MKLSSITEAKSGFNYINSGGVRDPKIEPTLQQTPRRNWKGTSRLPNLKELRYAGQLNERWPEFEKDVLPKILKFLGQSSRGLEHNWYVTGRIIKPALAYLAAYFTNSGCPAPPEFLELLKKHKPEEAERIINVLAQNADEVDWRPNEAVPEDFYAA